MNYLWFWAHRLLTLLAIPLLLGPWYWAGLLLLQLSLVVSAFLLYKLWTRLSALGTSG